MGRSSSEIEQEIEQQRERISEKLDHLQERVGSDIEETREEAKRQVKSAFGLADAARERMPLALAGAFGGALLLGVVTGAKRNR